jgi:hypothetical protein
MAAILFRVLSVLVLLTLLCFLVAELVPILQYMCCSHAALNYNA